MIDTELSRFASDILDKENVFKSKLRNASANAMEVGLPMLANWKKNRNLKNDIDESHRERDICIVFSTQRSGSTLLCELLNKYTVCGQMREHFKDYFAGKFSAKKVSSILYKGQEANVIGHKIMASQLLSVSALMNDTSSSIELEAGLASFIKSFRNKTVIHMERSNFLDQVLSLYTSKVTGLYFGGSNNSGDIEIKDIDYAEILKTAWSLKWGRIYIKYFVGKNFNNQQYVNYEEDLNPTRRESTIDRICANSNLQRNEITFDDEISLRPARSESNKIEVRQLVTENLTKYIGEKTFRDIFNVEYEGLF